MIAANQSKHTMITCSFCQADYVANTIYCSECGNYLLEAETRETDPLDIEKKGWIGKIDEDNPEYDLALQDDVHPVALRLKIGPGRREIEIPLNRAVHLGRVDPILDVFPEIDLSHEGELSRSISRRHATIARQGEIVVIEDTGSVNGTYVNGRRLDPYLPEIIKSGDILQLGKLQLEIEIIKQ
jgi:hypothetical protein